VALTAPAASAAPRPGKQLQPSPPGQILVASANLKASFSHRYVRSSGGRMRQLASKLLRHILERGGRWRPDVLLLQEALNKRRGAGEEISDDLSARRLASELQRMTGDTYAIVVDPGGSQTPRRGVSRETAIVANLSTMTRPSASGFVISNAYKRKLRFKGPGPVGGGRAPSRRQAWAVISERDPAGASFAVASVHLLTDKRLGCTRGAPCQRRINALKARWSRQVSEKLRASGGASFERAVIAGDFNATRKERFFGTMNRLGYRKAVRGRIDFVFSRGPIGLTGLDDSPDSGRGQYPLGYSDHRFLWATVG
jgi:endonuclease/exonuclease/phosphatase family metal-dependent hydrolase